LVLGQTRVKSNVLIPVNLLCGKCQFHHVFWLKSRDEKLVCKCGNVIWLSSLDPGYSHYFYYIFDLLKKNNFEELIKFYYDQGYVLTSEVVHNEIDAFRVSTGINQLQDTDYEKTWSLIKRFFELGSAVNPIENDLTKIHNSREFINYVKLHSPRVDVDKLSKILEEQSFPLSIIQLEEVKRRVALSYYKDDVECFVIESV
jgi:hypothetical protein